MRKTRRWLALILAVTLVSSNAIYQIGTTLQADEIEAQSEELQEQEAAEEPEEELPEVADSGEAIVEEVPADTVEEPNEEETETEEPDAEQPEESQEKDSAEKAENPDEQDSVDETEKTDETVTSEEQPEENEAAAVDSFAAEGGRAVTSADDIKIAVGETEELTGQGNPKLQYVHTWESSNPDIVKVTGTTENGTKGNVYAVAPGTATITHTFIYRTFSSTEKFVITVIQGVDATDISIEGSTTVNALETIDLTAMVTPADGRYQSISWQSSDETVLTVDENGKVTGVSEGTATVTVYMVKKDGTIVSASQKITITAAADNTKDVTDAAFYYLKTPTKSLDSNENGDWGTVLGKGKVNLVNATWKRVTGKQASNTYDNVGNRILSWPTSEGTAQGGTFVLNKGTHWTTIFNAYKSSVESALGKSITEDDVESITLIPYKISKDNLDGDKVHVDCKVAIKCKTVVTARFYTWDAGAAGYEQTFAADYNKGDSVTSTPKADQKKIVNGIEYEFDGWYTDAERLTPAALPYSITEDTDFYAKYIPVNLKYKVEYYWNGADQLITSRTGSGKRVGDTVVATPTAFNGYTPVSIDAKTITISENGENVIKFYYYKNVTLTADSDTETYSGQEQSVNGYVSSEVEADFKAITVGATGTDAGEYAAAFDESTVGTVDASEKYIVSDVAEGKLTIEPATLTVTTPDASKIYDGEALTAEGTISGFVNGETATFTTTGSQTVVGESSNTYTIEWNGTAKEDNYKIAEDLGTLKVTESTAIVTVTTTGGEFTYDGSAHGATVTVTGLPKGYKLETATSNATATDATTTDVEATCDNLVIKNASGKDVTASLKIQKVDGTIRIKPAILTVTTLDASKIYDGEALTAEGTISGFVNGETATFTTTGTQTEVGTSENMYEIIWDGTAKESNYQVIEESLGTLTVTEAVTEPEDNKPANNESTDNNPSNNEPTNSTPTDSTPTPTTPDNSTPTNEEENIAPQSTPDADTPSAVTPVTSFINNVVTPAVDTVKERVADIQQILQSDDEQIPLGDLKLDDHKCCVLHFLIMLLALLFGIFAFGSLKRRQKKLHEIREELDCELARRGLPVTSEKEEK